MNGFDLELRSLADVGHLLDRSRKEPLLLFKHSTACPVSAHALAEFRRYLEARPVPRPLTALVRVIEERPASLEAAARLAVTHASPQVIAVVGGEALGHLEHGAITAEAVASLAASLGG